MNTSSHIRDCLSRARDAFERRPSAALQEDSPALAVWAGALSARLSNDAVPSLRTDMPAVLGGEGTAPSPGWYFRAGVASCLVTSIAMQAATRGIALKKLEVQARSESDARGMLGVATDVPPGPLRVWLTVELEADDTPPETLREIVETAQALAAMSDTLRRPIPIAVDIKLAAT